MKIAIASSGLGHVSRGIETWALDTAEALHDRGVDVTLFSGGPLPATRVPTVVLQGWRRYEPRTQRLAAWLPGWAWRWGLKDPYGIEQGAYFRRLRRHLRAGRFDLLHVQDPMLAAWCRRWRRRGWLATREILAHGTEETHAFLGGFDYIQHLAPWHQEQAAAADGTPHPGWAAIPNFVDSARFAPAVALAQRIDDRTRLGLPAAGLLVGTVAAVKKPHKRLDYLIEEFARFLAGDTPVSRTAHLLIAGARQPDSDELVALAQRLAPGRIHVRFDLSREQMPALYRALDVFALVSLFEMMPIALLEAMASGCPCLTHHHPVLGWMLGREANGGDAGAAGVAVDMRAPGALADALAAITPDWLRMHGTWARLQAATRFDREVVVSAYIEYYHRVLQSEKTAAHAASPT